ncbi:MAG: DUF362 domain-containing protein [Candidatus Hydrothermarchaeaceae archaeon]
MVKVSIVKNETPDVERALELIGFRPTPCDVLVIKPNFCVPKHFSTGVTTDLRILEQVLKMYEGLAKERIVAESNGYQGTADEAYAVTGAKEICEYYGAQFVNLSSDICIPVKRDYEVFKDFKTPRTIMKADMLINLPVMKTHSIATVALSLMNLFGIIPGKKAIYHPRIADTVCDLLKIRKPDLNIMDGMIGMEGDETRGYPKRLDLVLAGTDPVALDTVCCKIMGINPGQVEHITKAAYHGFGESTLKHIEIEGESIEAVRERFFF